MLIRFFSNNLVFQSRIQYVINFLNGHPLKPSACKLELGIQTGPLARREVFFGKKPEGLKANQFFIPAQQLIFNARIVSSNQLIANEFYFKEFKLYSVETKNQTLQSFIKDQSFGFDLVETIFFHISRYEEWFCSEEDFDEWDMLKSSVQFLSKNKLHYHPVIDILVFCFFTALGFDIEKKQTTYTLTHDVDVPLKYPNFHRSFRAIGNSLKNRFFWKTFPKAVLYFFLTFFKLREDPFNTFDWLLWRNNKIEKIILFITGGITKYDNFYNIHDPFVEKIMELATARGYHIGFHPSYATFKNKMMFNKELNSLKKVCKLPIRYSRQHILHFSFRQTPCNIEESEIQMDSTLGFQDIIGFRCGTGFPYYLYNFENEMSFNFFELPMIVMDNGLLKEANNDLGEADELLFKLLIKNQCLTHVTFNFHNHIFDPVYLDSKLLKAIYQRLEDWVANQ